MSNRESELLEQAQSKGPLGRFLIYAKLSGPGWLQGAITLGSGSLAGALFLGIISGYGLLWVQPLAMICGVIMLSAISYVTLSTEARPFHAINRNLSPLLGWSWLIATIMANMVWTMPQFSLATGAIRQNLLGGAEFHAAWITFPLFGIAIFANYLYDAGGRGAKAFDLIIKCMVAMIILSFFAVTGSLLASGKLPLAEIFSGFAPNLSLLTGPAEAYHTHIAQSNFSDFWTQEIASKQRDVIITAFGTAVGINMTFLLPYSLLRKKWNKKHRGLSITDLAIGLFIPFFLATTCVVIAAASSFHGQGTLPAEADMPAAKEALVEQINAKGISVDEITESDLLLSSMLVKQDVGALAETLEPLAGEFIAQKIFGFGVFGMALSTIIILMLMNGLAFQEAFSPAPPKEASKRPLPADALDNKKLYFLGCCVSGFAGLCYPLLWANEKSHAALAVPTSVIGGSLIPIAYFTFFLMMNSKKILGDKRPTGTSRIIWNTLMLFATSVLTMGSIWVLHGKTEKEGWQGYIAWGGLVFLAILFVVGLVSFAYHARSSDSNEAQS